MRRVFLQGTFSPFKVVRLTSETPCLMQVRAALVLTDEFASPDREQGEIFGILLECIDQVGAQQERFLGYHDLLDPVRSWRAMCLLEAMGELDMHGAVREAFWAARQTDRERRPTPVHEIEQVLGPAQYAAIMRQVVPDTVIAIMDVLSFEEKELHEPTIHEEIAAGTLQFGQVEQILARLHALSEAS